jgi:hypothetical protein
MTVIINGSTGIDTVQDGIVTDGKLNLTANSQEIKDAINASGSAPIYACRAWVNLNNTGTPSIRASGNVSSITDNGTGIFTVNFSTAMPNTNYAVTSWVRSDSTSEAAFGYLTAYSNGNKSTSSMQFLQGVQSAGVTYTAAESTEVGIAFFR